MGAKLLYSSLISRGESKAVKPQAKSKIEIGIKIAIVNSLDYDPDPDFDFKRGEALNV